MKKSKSNKNKLKKLICNRLYLSIVGAIIVVIALGFIFRGWVRVTLIPKTASLFYYSGVQATTNKQLAELGNPFKELGYTKVTHDYSSCYLLQAQSIHTEIDCSDHFQAYAKLPTSIIALSNLDVNAQKVQNLLSKYGWQGGNNNVTVESLIDGIVQGKDYSPDAFYQKVIGSTVCSLDTITAYANPQAKAIQTSLFCERTIGIFGSPKDEIFNSSKGL